MKTVFQTGPCKFAIESDITISWQQDFLKFIIPMTEGTYPVFTLQGVDTLPQPKGKCVLNRADVTIFLDNGAEYRFYRLIGADSYFAMKSENQIFYLASCATFLENNRLLFSLLGLENQILKEGCILLHSSFLRYNGKAILFTGPSGIGKSTQADLWAKYRGAQIINGDRSLLCKTDTGWRAWGWPFSGSSTFCENESAPIHSIAILSQSKDNHLRKVTTAEAIRTIFGQVTINRWNFTATDTALTAIEDLCSQVPIWNLSCTMDEAAVTCFETALFNS